VCLAALVRLDWARRRIEDCRIAIGAVGPVPERLAEVERLCGQPASLPLELRRRRDLFVALRQGRQDPARLKAAAATDPLAALIAADLPAADLPAADATEEKPAAAKPPPANPRRPLQALGACPALLEALSRQWAQSPAATTP
jgi:hypothetical protein